MARNHHIEIVDADDQVIGSATMTEAHEQKLIHRIVRVLVCNSRHQILLQRRSEHIRIMPGRWDHSVGGHVDAGESYDAAAYRETEEELGLTGVTLQLVDHYYAEENIGPRIVYRYNQLYYCKTDNSIRYDTEEISEIKWVDMQKLHDWMAREPEAFTPPLEDVLNRVERWLVDGRGL